MQNQVSDTSWYFRMHNLYMKSQPKRRWQRWYTLVIVIALLDTVVGVRLSQGDSPAKPSKSKKVEVVLNPDVAYQNAQAAWVAVQIHQEHCAEMQNMLLGIPATERGAIEEITASLQVNACPQ